MSDPPIVKRAGAAAGEAHPAGEPAVGTPLRMPRLLDQQLALIAYLDALLREPTAKAPAVHREPASGMRTAKTDAPPAVPEAAAPRPEWGNEPFQCLLFNVAGLMLAVPLAKLNGIVPWDDGITPLPGQADWMLGLFPHQGGNVRVVDTARLVLPENRRGRLAPAQERSTHIVLIDEGRWGLACDALGEMITLDPSGVQWRTARGQRPWLAGTVREKLCALLDVDALARLLSDSADTGIPPGRYEAP